MNNFMAVVDEELKRQKELVRQCEKARSHEPEGYLKVRKRKRGAAFYACEKTDNIVEERLIEKELDTVDRLFRKKVNSEVLRRAKTNVKALKLLKSSYQPNSYPEIAEKLPEAYKRAAKVLAAEKSVDRNTGKPVQHCYEPDKHFHETLCGLYVRSKSEVIIANALYNYGIPFDYERKFPYPDYRGVRYRPDFSFDLPDGETLIWEHLGLMKKLDYCERTALKLMTYQQYGYLIGRNLLITQDDEMGNCSSSYIDKVIREKVLPYYK